MTNRKIQFSNVILSIISVFALHISEAQSSPKGKKGLYYYEVHLYENRGIPGGSADETFETVYVPGVGIYFGSSNLNSQRQRDLNGVKLPFSGGQKCYRNSHKHVIGEIGSNICVNVQPLSGNVYRIDMTYDSLWVKLPKHETFSFDFAVDENTCRVSGLGGTTTMSGRQFTAIGQSFGNCRAVINGSYVQM